MLFLFFFASSILFHFSFALLVFCFSAHPLKGIGIHPKRPRMFVDECTRNGKENQIERPSHAKERAERCRTRATRSTGSGRTCSTRKSSGSWELDRARSRLYRSKILQENMRLKALAEIYTMHSFAQLCNLNFFYKICQICCSNFVNFGNILAFFQKKKN